MHALKALIPAVLLAFGAGFGAEAAAKPLKPQHFQSYKQLRQVLSARKPSYAFGGFGRGCAACLNVSPMMMAGVPAQGAEAGSSFSRTNVQVDGVDEGDVAKTDGSHIYQIHGDRVRLIKAYPVGRLALASELTFTDGFYPVELYVDGPHLVVIGNRWQAIPSPWQDPPVSGTAPDAAPGAAARMMIWMPSGESTTTARVYDISDRKNPVLERELAIPGDHVASRRIGDTVYLIARGYPRYYLMGRMGAKAAPSGTPLADLVPVVRDSAVREGRRHRLALQQLFYFPQFVEPDYVTVAAFRLSAADEAANITAYYGAGDVAYASRENLFLSAADYVTEAVGADGSGTTATVSTQRTRIYKFGLKAGGTEFLHQGEVPGTVLNPFSMDERNGYFQIATTTDRWRWDGTNAENGVANNLYTLDAGMRRVASLENLAPGERIYSARFIADRCYLVTFQQIDPLFVIDRSDPLHPEVLGELKIPGYSTYLHPYGDHHLLGFGQDTATVDGRTATTGMKLALFDVTNVHTPTLLHSLVIGGPGTYSELLYDHKALYFDTTRELLGFPIAEYRAGQGEGDPEAWGFDTLAFQGAYVYRISLARGFERVAALTHLDGHAAEDGYEWTRHIRRLLSIDDHLYTLSDSLLAAHGLDDFREQGRLEFPADPVETPIAVPLRSR